LCQLLDTHDGGIGIGTAELVPKLHAAHDLATCRREACLIVQAQAARDPVSRSARPCRTSRAMIARTILHALWAVIVFAVTVALGVLFMLGSAWVGDELRAAAPHDPMLRHGAASVFGMVLFVGTVTPALTVLPAAIAAIVGEALRIRS